MLPALTRRTAGYVSTSSLRRSLSLPRRNVILNSNSLRSARSLRASSQAASLGVRHYSYKPSNEDPVGVAAAVASESQGTQAAAPRSTIFTREFSLEDRVALVSGGNGGIGLEAALAFLEAGARAVYCVDLPQEPSEAWCAAQRYASSLQLPGAGKLGRLEYLQGDVTDQKRMWKIAQDIGDKEKRMDAAFAAAGVAGAAFDCLEYPAEMVRQVLDVNTFGVLFTAQAAGRQMVRFGHGGSIILVASIAGSIALRDINSVSYNTSKGAVLQMARSMACELARRGVRVNSLSPGWIHTPMTAEMIAADVPYFEGVAPMARFGQPHELRGAAVWLASDASSFCTGSNILVDGGITAW